MAPIQKVDWILRDETGGLRGVNFPFEDTAAREISLRMVATSRFIGDFPTLPGSSEPPDQYALSRFEVESRPPMGSKRLQNAPPESYRTFKVLIPASTAPTAVVVSRLDWVMPETLTEFERGRRVCLEKDFYPRLYLGQDWCRFDELVAVICAPADLVIDRPYSPELMPPPPLAPIPLSGAEILRAMHQRNIMASDFSKGDPTGSPSIPDGKRSPISLHPPQSKAVSSTYARATPTRGLR